MTVMSVVVQRIAVQEMTIAVELPDGVDPNSAEFEAIVKDKAADTDFSGKTVSAEYSVESILPNIIQN